MKALLCAVCLPLILAPVAGYSQTESGHPAWTPSKPDSGPMLDYVRRVLTCDSLQCTMKVVRSQQELMEAMTFREIPEMRVMSMRQSTDGGKTWTTKDVSVPVYNQPMRLILGSCYGADLPVSLEIEHPQAKPAQKRAIASSAH